ncbi:MFS transporter [Ruicaihuangia caeni]|uniref:MFS transporter n=1 Tax=Ruicaihuangia caeni TaxID=3042517 RepID=A0AAW6TAX8_9MICO|nr:MFS transporter [Klugiella sp. YN-L-19]MDI2098973.1 MFS transporter [Klugiella sp. YN-L-19]
MSAMFLALRGMNYRLWFAGALISNVGLWMQRTAQDWLVLTELTDNDATALGINMGLQFAPQLLLVPWAGLIADRFERRHLLIITQASAALLAVGLGALVLTGHVALWHVFAFSAALGVVSAIDSPARQAFVSDLVRKRELPNAVALNAASFNTARLIGPAVAGGLVVLVGPGWVFVLNAGTYAATITALLLLNASTLFRTPRAPRGKGELLAGFRYVRRRGDLLVLFIAAFIIGTFGLNFPIYSSTMTRIEFGLGAGEYGVLSSILAIGSITGALVAARRERPRLRIVFGAAGLFGLACLLSAAMPSFWSYAVSLIVVGLASTTFMTTANATIQTTTSPVMRGRVMALYMAIFVGGTPLGAPIVGWIASEFGPRSALLVGAASGIVTAIIGVAWMVVAHDLRLRYSRRHPRRFYFTRDGQSREAATSEIAITETIATKGS